MFARNNMSTYEECTEGQFSLEEETKSILQSLDAEMTSPPDSILNIGNKAASALKESQYPAALLETAASHNDMIRGASFSSISTWSSVYMQDCPVLDTSNPAALSEYDIKYLKGELCRKTRPSEDSGAEGGSDSQMSPEKPAGSSNSSTTASRSAAVTSAACYIIPLSYLYRHAASACTWLLACTASNVVTFYDVAMRIVMVSYYIIGLDTFTTVDHYLRTKAKKQSRRYLDSCSAKYEAALETYQLRVNIKPTFSPSDFAFARHIFTVKHGKPVALYWAWRCLVAILQCCAAPGAAHFSTVTDVQTGEIVALFVEFRQKTMHHFITAMVEHETSQKHGVYVAKYSQLLASCISGGIPLLRLGPTCDDLKTGLGALPLPLLVVGTCVWAKVPGRCSVVAFGIFTTVALFIYLFLTQYHLETSGVGAMTVGELSLLYCCGMGCVKLLPLWSIGFRKIYSNPRKYLLQTSFYAQGLIPGAMLAIFCICAVRGINPLLLLDGLALFGLVGEAIGRLGCHFYGCCFGRPAMENPQHFTAWSVVYIHKSSSVARLRPEFLLRPLMPTQLLQTLYAAVTQTLLLAYVTSCQQQQQQVAVINSDTGNENSGLLVGIVSVYTLVAYSVGRLLFFMVREDENFKSNRSYTTAYMALGTLGGAACAAAFSIYQATPSPITLMSSPVFAGMMPSGAKSTTAITAGCATALPLSTITQFVILAGVLAGINFVVQALHHHEKVGQFPDLAALAGFSARSKSRAETFSNNDKQTFGAASLLPAAGTGMWAEDLTATTSL
ncbi:hypothetical protein CEUSTIGMA_g8086.t1 [Chlamydomonas eustigma]|uniref:Uncharacterized protein n=1 Tax=Chlamydomonas eustigma TaxID=1157962 RepID=A0A250XC48_9CHLO|nr:hypothetical protein CEUSTIGMA_g8086.t1 [Chlamydomonas eustigma]|eukprot:GAX80651.1 hypothetical protein CEUSTIGMA_g8086.t1 [Chlamydomonas eustigma]